MDDEDKYGPQFHRLPFSKAVELGELSDYKVAIFGISEHEVNANSLAIPANTVAKSISTTQPESSAAGAHYKTLKTRRKTTKRSDL